MSNGLVELPNNQIIFLIINLEFHYPLLEFRDFRNNFIIKVFHVLVLGKSLELSLKALAILGWQLVTNLSFKFKGFLFTRMDIFL